MQYKSVARGGRVFDIRSPSSATAAVSRLRSGRRAGTVVIFRAPENRCVCVPPVSPCELGRTGFAAVSGRAQRPGRSGGNGCISPRMIPNGAIHMLIGKAVSISSSV